MKIFALNTIALLTFNTGISAKESVQNEFTLKKHPIIEKSTDKEIMKLHVHIEFGRVSKNCEGWGICDIDITIDAEPSDFNFKASSNTKGKLELEMTQLELDNVIKKTFGSSTIIIEEDYKLKDSICEKLGLIKGYTVKAGKYAVTKNSSGIYSAIL